LDKELARNKINVIGNPADRPRGLPAYVRENTDGGAEILELMVSVMRRIS